MDDITHLLVAKGFLRLVEKPEDYAIFSLAPIADAEPRSSHRICCHTFFNFPRLITAAEAVFCGLQKTARSSWYEYSALQKQAASIYLRLKDARIITNIQRELKPDKEAELLAIVSHLYLDLFSNPLQPFAPVNNWCCGRWELWRNIDYLKLHKVLRTPERIAEIHKKLGTFPVWTVFAKSDPKMIILSQLWRICDSLASPEREKVGLHDKVTKLLGSILGGDLISQVASIRDCQEMLILQDFEKYLSKTIVHEVAKNYFESS